MSTDEKLEKQLRTILEKRQKCEPLTVEEEQLAQKMVDKLILSKKSLHKKFQTTTGDDVRKQAPTLKKPKRTKPSFEDGNPKNRGLEGGYDSKADVDERTPGSPNEGQPTKPTRQDSDRAAVVGKETPKEDNSGNIKAEYSDEEYHDTDEKEYQNEWYEEDRVARYTEGRTNRRKTISVNDIVTKEIRKGLVLVGHVLKIYGVSEDEGPSAILVKWSTGHYTHENANNVTVLEKKQGEKSAKVKSEEDKKASPPVAKTLKPLIDTGTSTRKLGKLSDRIGKQSEPSDVEDALPADLQEKVVSLTAQGLVEEHGMSEDQARKIAREGLDDIISGMTEKVVKVDKPSNDHVQKKDK